MSTKEVAIREGSSPPLPSPPFTALEWHAEDGSSQDNTPLTLKQGQRGKGEGGGKLEQSCSRDSRAPHLQEE